MNSIEIELNQDKPGAARRLKQWLLEKAQAWLNGLLAAELGRKRGRESFWGHNRPKSGRYP